MRCSSSVPPLAFVVESCHDADLALLSIAKRTPTAVACCSTASISDSYSSIGLPMPKYMLAMISLTLSTVISATIESAAECCFNSRTSICLFVTTMAVLLLVPASV